MYTSPLLLLIELVERIRTSTIYSTRSIWARIGLWTSELLVEGVVVEIHDGGSRSGGKRRVWPRGCR